MTRLLARLWRWLLYHGYGDDGAPVMSPRDVYVTADLDPGKTVAAINNVCGCPIYAEDLPIRDWRCEHGNYWLAARR